MTDDLTAFNGREMDRLTIMGKLAEGRLSQRQAAQSLSVVHSVHDSVRSFDDLANLRVGELGHNSARAGKVLKPLNRFEQAGDDEICVRIRVVRYELPDCLHVFDRLGRPSKLDHPSKRSLTSSWEIVFPAFACCRPRSTLAKKQSFSIASSSVASSGSSSTALRIRSLAEGSPMKPI